MTERIQDVTHLGRIELLTPKLDRSRWYFEKLLGYPCSTRCERSQPEGAHDAEINDEAQHVLDDGGERP
jgi:hypothetical protein